MKFIKIFSVLLLLGFNTQAQVKAQDGKTYGTAKIGDQLWTTENLNVSTYRNGDIIPQVQDSVAWAYLTTGAWCYYENKTANGTKYGKLYNWYAVNDPRGLAPEGWHVPTEEELMQLMNKFTADKMKSGSGWDEDVKIKNNKDANSTGFSALPAGCRYENGRFVDIGLMGIWWSSSEVDNSRSHSRYLTKADYFSSSLSADKKRGSSVRCIKD